MCISLCLCGVIESEQASKKAREQDRKKEKIQRKSKIVSVTVDSRYPKEPNYQVSSSAQSGTRLRDSVL